MGLFTVSFKKECAYKASVVFNIIGSVVSMLISIALWNYIYRDDPMKIQYMTLYVLLSNIISFCYSDEICVSIEKKVTSGEFAFDLLRPIHFVLVQYFECLGKVCATLLLKGLPVAILFAPVMIQSYGTVTISSLVVALISIILGHFMFTILFSLVGFLSFVFLEIWPFRRLMNDTIRFLSGSFIPLALFPAWLKKVADVLPFRFLYSVPIELITGNVTLNEAINGVVTQLLWLIILAVLLLLSYQKALYKSTVQGG